MEKHYRDIKNEMAYFYTVIKNMNTKDNIKKSKVKKHEISLDEVMYDNFSDDFDIDKQFLEKNLLGWIELIENSDLYKAIKSLTIQEQTLLSYIFYKEKTQTEIARIFGVSQSAIFQKFNNIIRKIKLFISKT